MNIRYGMAAKSRLVLEINPKKPTADQKQYLQDLKNAIKTWRQADDSFTRQERKDMGLPEIRVGLDISTPHPHCKQYRLMAYKPGRKQQPETRQEFHALLQLASHVDGFLKNKAENEFLDQRF